MHAHARRTQRRARGQTQFEREVGAVVRVVDGLLRRNGARLDQTIKRLVKAAHALLAAPGDGCLEVVDLPLLDQIGDVGCEQHDFGRKHQITRNPFDQTLRKHGTQIEG